MDFCLVFDSFDKQCIVTQYGLYHYKEVKVYELERIRLWISLYGRERTVSCYSDPPITNRLISWESFHVIIKLFHCWCLKRFCGRQIILFLVLRKILCLICPALLFVVFEKISAVPGHFLYYDMFPLCNIHIRTCKFLRIFSTCVNTALVVDIIILFYFILLSVIVIDS